MKYICLLLTLVILSCDSSPQKINPNSFLSQKEQESFKYKIIRYIERLPKGATESTKFNADFDQYYKNSSKQCDLLFYFKGEDNNVYFGISKIAPSVKLKKTATVGRLQLNNKGAVIFYEEAFRTWKMEPAELENKTKMLFTKYINQEDLSPYYTVNSQPEFYIEFPDQNTYFDTQKRMWVLKNKNQF